MAELIYLTEFFARHGGQPEEEFLASFDGFLLGRSQGSPPYLIPLSKDPEVVITIGSDEDCDLDIDDPTMDPVHAKFVFHEGFKGWTVEDNNSNFGTYVAGERVSGDRPVLLVDKQTVKPGGGYTQLQFYEAKTLYQRIAKAGITRTLKKRKNESEG